MAQRIEIEDITINPGVLKTAPQTFTLPWREGYPESVQFRFPPGPSGLVGLQLLHSGRIVIPKRGLTFLVADNEVPSWDLEGFPYNAVYTVRAYNEGVYVHTVQIRMGLNEISHQVRPGTQILTVTQQVPSYGRLGEGLGV